MNPAAMVALIDYREIDGEERPVNTRVIAFAICKCSLSGDYVLQAWS